MGATFKDPAQTNAFAQNLGALTGTPMGVPLLPTPQQRLVQG